MKRLSETLLFTCLILLNAYGQTIPKFGGLKGNINQIFEENYIAEYKSGKIVPGEKIDHTGKRPKLKIFDTNGNCIRVNSYQLNNNISAFYISEFDSLGCGKKTSYYSGDSVLTGYILNECDKQGNDLLGIRYDKAGKIVDKYIWKYNNHNYLIETLEYKAETLERKTTYQYDKTGNQIETRIYSSKDSLIGMYKKEFDSAGNIIVEKLYSKEALYSIKYIQYDNYQNIREEITYSAQGKIISKTNYEFKYDIKGNWIERIEFNSDTPKTVTTRKIIYYN